MSRRSMKEKLQTGANFKKYAHFPQLFFLNFPYMICPTNCSLLHCQINLMRWKYLNLIKFSNSFGNINSEQTQNLHNYH